VIHTLLSDFVSKGPVSREADWLRVRNRVRGQARSSFCDDLEQVLHDEHQMVRIAWARFKREVFIEGPGLVIFGMHQQRPGADGLAHHLPVELSRSGGDDG
jgi:hypothetical protein